MTKEIIKFAFLFVLLLLCQVVVFNHICLFGVAIPLAFIYFIIKLPVSLGTNWVMTVSFLIGITLDIFSDTQGMNALACTVLSVCRHPILRLYMPRQDDLPSQEPSIRILGVGVFMRYALTMSIIYCVLFFTIEAFTFLHPLQLLLKIISSSLLTFIIILAFDGFTNTRR